MKIRLLVFALLANYSFVSFAAEVTLRASELASSETKFGAGGVQSLVTWATTSVSEEPRLEAHFIASESIDTGGKSFNRIIPVVLGGHEHSAAHSKGADCVFESFALRSLNDITYLITAERYYDAKKVPFPSQAEPARQIVKVFLLEKNNKFLTIQSESRFKYGPISYFRFLSSHITVDTACSDHDVDSILLNSINIR
jgi:hypothetical protein